MNKNKKHFSGNSGYSLIELAVTVIILGVLLSTGFTAFGNSINTQKAGSAAERIMLAVKKARHYSRTKGVLTSLFFTEGSNSYSITADGEILSESSLFDAFSGVLPENTIIIQNTCESINFYADGSLVNPEGDIVIENCYITTGYVNGSQKTVVIQGYSGNATIQ